MTTKKNAAQTSKSYSQKNVDMPELFNGGESKN